MQLSHCERLIYVCNTSGEETDKGSGPVVFAWKQVTAVEQPHHRQNANSSDELKEPRRFVSCQRCSELAELTLQTFDAQSEEGVFSSRQVICQPGKCPKCSQQLLETTVVTTLDSLDGDDSTLLEYYDLPTEQTQIVLVDESVLEQAQERIAACEHCTDDAEITFDYVLDAVTGNDPTVTQYVLYSPAKCPRCFNEVNEKTLIIPE